MAHVTLSPEASVRIPVTSGWTAALGVVDGAPTVLDRTLEMGDTVVFDDEGELLRVSTSDPAQLLLMSGAKLREPIVAGGGFVMTSAREINQAFADYRTGRMGELAPSRR